MPTCAGALVAVVEVGEAVPQRALTSSGTLRPRRNTALYGLSCSKGAAAQPGFTVREGGPLASERIGRKRRKHRRMHGPAPMGRKPRHGGVFNVVSVDTVRMRLQLVPDTDHRLLPIWRLASHCAFFRPIAPCSESRAREYRWIHTSKL